MTRMAIGAAIAAAWAVPAAAADFTGPRFDLVTGYDRADGYEGVIYGGTLGADFRVLDKVRIGIEAGYSDSTMKEGGCRGGREIDAALRLGYVVGSRLMLYGKAGYVNAHYSGAVNDCSRRLAGKHDLGGVRIGAGAEYAFSDRVFARAEVRYANLARGRERDQFIAGVGVRF